MRIIIYIAPPASLYRYVDRPECFAVIPLGNCSNNFAVVEAMVCAVFPLFEALFLFRFAWTDPNVSLLYLDTVMHIAMWLPFCAALVS